MSVKMMLIGLAVLMLGFAPAPFSLADKAPSGTNDLKKLEGEWCMVSATYEGRPAFRTTKVTLRIEGTTLTPYYDASIPRTYTLMLDSRKIPKVVDYRHPEDGKEHTWRGIYRLEGDILTICRRKSERPAHFADSTKETFCEVYKRKKP
jgi:uncharacterized protein (TIGR03067 family)